MFLVKLRVTGDELPSTVSPQCCSCSPFMSIDRLHVVEGTVRPSDIDRGHASAWQKEGRKCGG